MKTWFFYLVDSPDDGGWYYHAFEHVIGDTKSTGKQHTSENIWDTITDARIAAIDWLDRHEHRWIELDPIR